MIDCLVLMLEGQGWVVEGVTSPLVALQRIRGARFDIVVTDVRMPAMSGTELFHEAIAIQPHLKVILISGQDSGQSPPRGVFAFLATLFKAGALVRTVERAVTESGSGRS